VPDIFELYPNLEYVDTFSYKVPNIKFHENPSSGSCAETCEQADGWMDKHNKSNTCLP